MASYKAVMRPALEYVSSIWSPLASSTSINKLQVMQNAALINATGCTQDTNIQQSKLKQSVSKDLLRSDYKNYRKTVK